MKKLITIVLCTIFSINTGFTLEYKHLNGLYDYQEDSLGGRLELKYKAKENNFSLNISTYHAKLSNDCYLTKNSCEILDNDLIYCHGNVVKNVEKEEPLILKVIDLSEIRVIKGSLAEHCGFGMNYLGVYKKVEKKDRFE